jgi:hypothetical protein
MAAASRQRPSRAAPAPPAASGSPAAPAPQATSTYKLQELEKQGLVVDEELLKLPKGYHWCAAARRARPPRLGRSPPDLTRPAARPQV